MRVSILSIITTLVLMLSFQNCAPTHEVGDGSLSQDSGSGPGGSNPTGNPLNGDTVSGAIFQNTVFPILNTNCAGCHGASQVPLFMSSDPQITHDLLVINNLVDVASPSSSRIAVKIQGGHQSIPVSVGNDILQAIIQWGNDLP